MRNLGLLAFGITTCALVPTTLHFVQAGPNQVAKLVAPDMTSIQVDGAKVDVVADRGLVDAGGQVHVTLSATADKRVAIPLTVLVYEARGTGGGRVDAPPQRVDRRDVRLDVKDGKTSQTLAFTLRGFLAQYMDGQAVFGHYTVLVMPTKAANALEHDRRRVKVGMADYDDPGNFMEAYRTLGDDTAAPVARLEVSTRSSNDELRIIAPDTARAGDDITVKVRIKNSMKYARPAVAVKLAVEPDALDEGGNGLGTWTGLGSDDVQVDAPTAPFALAAKESKELVFHVHAKTTGTLGLFASVTCLPSDDNESDCDSANMTLPDPTLEAIDILPAPDPAPPKTAQADTK
jgi:hypothetical protein